MKNILGYEGYKISKSGKVFKNGKERAYQKTKEGRYRIRIKGKRFQISRLVALAYIPNPNNYPCVLHLDNNPGNNHYKNLRWGTQQMNMDQKMKEGRYRGNNKLTLEEVKRIRSSKADNRDLAELYGVSYGHIVSIKNGRASKKMV